MSAVGFSNMAYIMLRKFPCISIFVFVFIMKDCWIFLNNFSSSIESQQYHIYGLWCIIV